MNCCDTLPVGYKEICKVDLVKDKKAATIVNIAAALIFIAMCVVAAMFVPISSLFDFENGYFAYFAKFIVIIIGYIAYIILHELVHGIFMKAFSGKRPKYGFTGLYAYAGSDCYFDKKRYIIVALAPIIIWGIVLLSLNIFLPLAWFWPIYLIQAGNISGAAGDLYVTILFSKLPKDILVKDTGVAMTVYSEEVTECPEE